MKYNFPKITHIDQIKSILPKDGSFFIKETEEYDVISYTHVDPSTFPLITDEASKLLRECRGIKFDKQGNLIQRNYQKFFNFGEKGEVYDFSEPHIIMEKLDGSMISPMIVNGEIKWTTKMGITDVANLILPVLEQNPNYVEFAQFCLEDNYTPIFEFCSRKQQIIIDYGEQDHLFLTGIREMDTGIYVHYTQLVDLANEWDIELCPIYQVESISDMNEFVQSLNKREGIEGVVIRFDWGGMLKVKLDSYVKLHKCKESIQSEKDVFQLWLMDGVDDLIPFLNSQEKDRVESFISKVSLEINDFCHKFTQEYPKWKVSYPTKKDFAINIAPTLNGYYRHFAFKIWEQKTALTYSEFFDMLKEKIIDMNNTKYEEFKKMVFPSVIY